MARAMLLVVVFLFLVCGGAADNHVVGGSSGWDLKSNVGNWSLPRRFRVGDALIFNYRPVHDVVEVNRSEFQMCNFVNPIATFDGGFTVIFLGETGHRYFVCSEHCRDGMKMQIEVLPPKLPRSPRGNCQNQPPQATPPQCGKCSCAKQLIIVSAILLILLVISIFSAIVGFRISKAAASTTITTNQATSTATPIASTATTAPAIDHPQSPLLAIEYPDTQSSFRAPEEALATAMAEREV